MAWVQACPWRHFATQDYLLGEDKLAELLLHREDLAETDRLIDQLGWQLDQPREETTLEGERRLLHEAATALVTDAEKLNDACLAYRPGNTTIVTLTEQIVNLTRVLDLVDQTAPPDPSPTGPDSQR